ncbi:MAG TPA: LacI family transcriptional regulator [Firmicutes bacterium]|jgi:DNA-binding LacI/PurR family transcriptional regulator|nr:LacI family transcriptional regulator [Bacillota bacterium]
MPINIVDVANKAGVCITTVSRVLNNNGQVRESNRLKVNQAIAELGYNRNAAARTLVRGKSETLGIVVPTLNDPFWADLVTQIEHAAFDHGYLVVLALTTDNNDEVIEKRWIKVFSEGRVDGIFLIAPGYESDYISELRIRNFPFVLLDNNQNTLKMPSIIVDNTEGGYLATRHLIELGHKRIGHIAGNLKHQSARERLQGYYKALNQFDLAVDEHLIGQGNFAVKEAFRIATEWLSQKQRPTAIFAADDTMALACLEAARRLNLEIPRDLSIIGYDDSSICSVVTPCLSTIKQPTSAMASEAVQLLLKYLENKTPRNKTVIISPELIVRESTGPG